MKFENIPADIKSKSLKEAKNEIELILARLEDKNLNLNDKIAFTCGSGMTACVLGLANSLINGTNPIIYDESWSGYGLINNDNKK